MGMKPQDLVPAASDLSSSLVASLASLGELTAPAAGGPGGPASWAEVRGGKIVQLRLGAACCSQIQTCEAVVGLSTVSGSLPECSQRFLDWLYTRSWAAGLFAAHGERWCVISGGLPANVVVNLLTMQRCVREHLSRVKLMYEFVDVYGCSEDLAFLCAFSCHGTGWPSINVNHNPIDPVTPDYWRAFMSREIQEGNLKQPLTKSNAYSGVTALWGKTSGMSDAKFPERLLATLPSKTETDSVVIANPFKPVVSTTTVVTLDNFKAVLPEIIKMYDNKEIKYERKVA